MPSQGNVAHTVFPFVVQKNVKLHLNFETSRLRKELKLKCLIAETFYNFRKGLLALICFYFLLNFKTLFLYNFPPTPTNGIRKLFFIGDSWAAQQRLPCGVQRGRTAGGHHGQGDQVPHRHQVRTRLWRLEGTERRRKDGRQTTERILRYRIEVGKLEESR